MIILIWNLIAVKTATSLFREGGDASPQPLGEFDSTRWRRTQSDAALEIELVECGAGSWWWRDVSVIGVMIL